MGIKGECFPALLKFGRIHEQITKVDSILGCVHKFSPTLPTWQGSLASEFGVAWSSNITY